MTHVIKVTQEAMEQAQAKVAAYRLLDVEPDPALVKLANAKELSDV